MDPWQLATVPTVDRKKDDDPKAKILQNVNPNVFPSFKTYTQCDINGPTAMTYICMLSVFVSFVIWRIINAKLFPRASERRVLPIVGVCKNIFSSSHLLIFTSYHPHIFSSSHLLIFTSSHLHIFSSSHLLIFTSSHLHTLTSSHLLIFTSAHLHIFSSSHLLIFTSSHSLLPSCSLALLLSPSFLFLSWRRGQRQRDGTKRNPFPRNEVR